MKHGWGRMRNTYMNIERTLLVETISEGDDRLVHIPQAEFVAAWQALVGEPPAMMLEDRSEMIRVLVQSVPIVPEAGGGKPTE